MADEAQVIRAIDWRSAFPFTQIFRSFRVAIHPSKLVLALLALLLIYTGGRLLDGLWLATPHHRAVPEELMLYEQTRGTDDPSRHFNDARNERYARMHADYRDWLTRIGKPDGDLDDIKYAIVTERDRRAGEIRAEYDRVPNDPADAKFRARRTRDERVQATYQAATREYNRAALLRGRGLFQTFYEHQLGQVNAVVRGVRTGNWIGSDGVTEALVRFFAMGPMWALRHHYVYFTIFGLYFLIIWSIFGGAIARIAAVHVARDEKISIRQALAFSIAKFLSFLSAPIIPLLIILVIGIVVAAGGFLLNIPGIGPVLVGALFFLALAAGFVMTLVLLGTLGGFNLMYPTIAVEGSDSFDAISRSFSYLYARPWRLAFYTAVAIAYGALCYLFVRYFIYLMLALTHYFAGLWTVWAYANDTSRLWPTMWPSPFANDRLTYDIDFLTLSTMQDLGGFLLAFWVFLTIAMLGAFAISFYFSANTVIYFLMRHEVDATELDDVYLEQSEEDFAETSGAPGAGEDTGTAAVATSAAGRSESEPLPGVETPGAPGSDRGERPASEDSSTSA